MSYLKTRETLLSTIDDSYGQIVRLTDRYRKTHREVQTWWDHFSCIWAELVFQLGWYPRKSRRRAILERICSGITFGVVKIPEERIAFESGIFRGEVTSAMTFPPEFSSYPTAYGFYLCTSGRDMWHPLATGHYATELFETVLLLRLARYINAFVDVGANVGFFSLLMAQETNNGVLVLAFEPASENCRMLEAAIKRNGMEHRIQVFSRALGREVGIGTLRLNDLGSGGNTLMDLESQSFVKAFKKYNVSFTKSEAVNVDTLDSLHEANQGKLGRALVKIDVEGFEKEVLSGGATWLAGTDAPIILFEAWPDSSLAPPGKNHAEVIRLLQASGYSLFMVNMAEHKRSPLTPLEIKWRIKASPTGNYLAVPGWARPIVGTVNEPVDMRIFTRQEHLSAVHNFLDKSLISIRAHTENLKEGWL